jgi:hypothetical protein
MKARHLFFLLLFACNGDANGGNAFDRASAAVSQGRYREAAELFATASKTESDPKRRADAELELAKLEWRGFRELGKARARLAKLDAPGARIVAARMAIEQRDYATARVEANKAGAVATNKRERRRALVVLANAIVRDPAASSAELRELVVRLRESLAKDGAYLAPSRALVRAALRAGDGAAALEGIDGYYHVSPHHPPPRAIAAAHAELARLLPSWSGGASIARALGGVRMFEEAALVEPNGEIAQYAATLRRIEDRTNELYRLTALGDGQKGAFDKLLERELKAPREQLAKRFGMHIITGKTSGHHDMHLAHIVEDRTMDVEQYGRRAKVRFVALDGVVSNGFAQWANDDASGDGGWGTAEEIYQVRPLYADGALRNWELVTDGADEDRKRTEEESRRDLERARANPVQSFPGLAMRVQRQWLERVAREEKTREGFLARVEDESFHWSIVAHEGRHAIDAGLDESFKTWELEYRAKLSQIAFAAAPHAALEGIVDHDVGGDSPHGKGNGRLMKELAQWMKAHAKEIAGLDRAQPLLPQLDKLSAEQLRAAVRSLDPLPGGLR